MVTEGASQAFTDSAQYSPVAAFMTSGMVLKAALDGTRPNAFILLDSTQKSANKRMCQSFKEMPNASDLPDPNTKTAPIWWFLKNTPPANRDCSKLVKDYDYAQANIIRSQYRLGARGVFLVAVDKANRPYVVDLTNASKEQIDEVLLSWTRAAKDSNGDPTVVVSTKFWDILKMGLCNNNVFELTPAAIGNALSSPGTTAIGYVAIAAGKAVACGKIA